MVPRRKERWDWILRELTQRGGIRLDEGESVGVKALLLQTCTVLDTLTRTPGEAANMLVGQILEA